MQRVDRPRSTARIVVAASNTAAYLQRSADYVCDGTADNVEIQAAIDLAQTFVIATAYAAPVVELLPGQYSLSAGITKKSAPIKGDTANLGVRIKWDGATGATVVTQSGVTAGSCSFGGIEGVTFTAGTNEPDTWLDLTADAVDVFYLLRHVHFSNCASDALKMAGWVNAHWEHLRFDNPGGYAIRATVPVSQNCSDFHLSDFTYAHTRATTPGKGVFLIDNTVGESNIGTVCIEHARIEVQSGKPWKAIASGGTRAVFTLALQTVAPPVRSCAVELRNLDYSDSSGMADDSLFYRSTTDTTGSEKVLLENIVAANLSTTFGGTYAATMPTIAFPAAGIGLLQLQGGQITIFSTEEHRARTSTDAAWQSTVAAEAVARLVVRADGLMSWSDGTNAADVTFGRAATNKMTVTASAGLACSGPMNPNNTNAKIYSGAGTPEGSVTANIGSLYLRTDGGAGTSHYCKESGSGNTGWVGK